MPALPSVPPLALARSSSTDGGRVAAGKPRPRRFQGVFAQVVRLRFADLRAIERQCALGEVDRRHVERGDFPHAQAVIEQQAQQQRVAPSLRRVRVLLEGFHLRAAQGYRLGFLHALTGRHGVGAALFVDALLLFVLVAADRANEGVLLGSITPA